MFYISALSVYFKEDDSRQQERWIDHCCFDKCCHWRGRTKTISDKLVWLPFSDGLSTGMQASLMETISGNLVVDIDIYRCKSPPQCVGERNLIWLNDVSTQTLRCQTHILLRLTNCLVWFSVPGLQSRMIKPPATYQSHAKVLQRSLKVHSAIAPISYLITERVYK